MTDRRYKLLLGLYLCSLLAWFVVRTAHWPLVNDAAQLHYVCFLMDHGMAPYRDILEINMPGTYLMNWSVMHTLGAGSVAWRVFDLAVLGLAAGAMIAIAWPYEWMAGALAASLFALYHGKDGAGQQGQRDLVIAALLLWACALLFRAFRSRRRWPLFLFGLCGGAAVTVKPLPLPFLLLLLVAAAVRWRQAKTPLSSRMLYALLGFLVPILIVISFLARHHALASFWYVLHVGLPFYQQLGRLPWPQLVVRLTSMAVVTLGLISLVISVLQRDLWNWEGTILFSGLVFGAASFLLQGKGLPYHRYPMLAFLFLWAALQVTAGLRTPGWAGVLAKAGLCFSLILLLIAARVATRRVWATPFEDSLASDLYRLGGEKLNGHVQCLDMPADCHTTLYRMQLVQSTGLFYDYLVFGSTQQAVIRDMRARFWREFQENRPLIIVMGKGLFPIGGGYEKVATWPLLQQELSTHYTLYDERAFPRADAGERAYRIYIDHERLAQMTKLKPRR